MSSMTTLDYKRMVVRASHFGEDPHQLGGTLSTSEWLTFALCLGLHGSDDLGGRTLGDAWDRLDDAQREIVKDIRSEITQEIRNEVKGWAP